MQDLIEALNRAHELDEARLHESEYTDSEILNLVREIVQDGWWDTNYSETLNGDNLRISVEAPEDEDGRTTTIVFNLSMKKLRSMMPDDDAIWNYVDVSSSTENELNKPVDHEDQASDFYHRAEQELEKHFNCTGAFLEPSTQNGVGRTFLFADDMSFDGSFDFETGEDYIFEDDFDGFLALCKRSFTPTEDEVDEGIFSESKKSVQEAAFSGGMAGDNSASGGTIRGRGASTQPGKNNYLNRMKSKNPDLVDTMVIKVSDIKPGMITQAGQVKEAEARNHPSGGKKMYIMHTNGYDGFWGLDETMDVMVDPENKSKPFAGDYRALLKMGLQEECGVDEPLKEAREKTVDEANVKTAVCGVLDAAVNTLGKNISYKLLAITLSKEIRPVEWHAYVKFVPQGDILQRVDTGHLDYRYGRREANDPECAVSLIIPSNVTLDRSSLLDQESKVVKTITDKYELSQARSSRQDDVDKILQSAKAIARKAGLDARWDSSHERHGSLYLRVVYPQEPDIVFDYGGYPERSLYAQHNGLSVYSDATADRSPYVPYYKYSGSNDVTAILDRFRMNVTDVKNNLDELLSKLNTAKENVAYNKNADNINRYIEKVVAQSNIPGLVGHYSKEYNWVTFNSINLKSSVIVEIHPTCKIDDDSMVDETIKRLKNKTYAKLRKAPKKIEV